MRSFGNVFLGLLAVSVVLASGCGGTQLETGAIPSGEGNIPIGRTPVQSMGECNIHIVNGDGTTIDTVTQQQVIYVGAQLKGIVRVRVEPINTKFMPTELVYRIGAQTTYTMNVRPADQAFAIRVGTVGANLFNGQAFRLGVPYSIHSFVNGMTTHSVSPTIFVSGGVGRLEQNDVFVPTQPGVGQIVLQYAGMRHVYGIRVLP